MHMPWNISSLQATTGPLLLRQLKHLVHVHIRGALDGMFGGGMQKSCSGGRGRQHAKLRHIKAPHQEAQNTPMPWWHTTLMLSGIPAAAQPKWKKEGLPGSTFGTDVLQNVLQRWADMPGGLWKAAHLSLIHTMSRTQSETPGCTRQTRGLGQLIWQACDCPGALS